MSDFEKWPYQLQANKVNLENEIALETALAAERKAFNEEKESVERLIYPNSYPAGSSKYYISPDTKVANEEVKKEEEPPVVKRVKVNDKNE